MKRLIFIIPLFFLLLSCEMKEKSDTLSILTWNMYLFFDDEVSGKEYAPFRPETGYGPEQYQQRIRKTVNILSTPTYESDILLLQEVESEKVLEDLLNAGLSRKGYQYYGLLEINSPITVGYISKYRPISTNIHKSMRDRPILELVFRIGGEKIHLFVLHARSQLSGGELERREMFTLLDQLMKDRGENLSIAMGDFNEDPRIGEAFQVLGKEDSPALLVTGDGNLTDYGVYYDPALDENYPCKGSYYYNGFLTLDHAIFSSHAFDERGHDFSYATLLYPEGGVDEAGRPIRYSPESGIGLSDHFALKAELKYN